MRIIVNHLTRMQPGYICAAGVDVRSGQHIRPVLGGMRLSNTMLRRHGGVLDVGSIIDLGNVDSVGQPPEYEDHLFSPGAVWLVNSVAPSDFWTVLEHVAVGSLEHIFGRNLQRTGRSYTVDAGGGNGSLGCLRPTQQPMLYVDDFGAVRLVLPDSADSAHLPVTDVRLYADDQKALLHTVINRVAERLRRGEEVILNVGLTRLWQKPGDNAARHWLQVNNIYLKHDPFLRDDQ